MNEPLRIEVSEAIDPDALRQLVAGSAPIEITDHGEVIQVVERHDRPMTAEELMAFWESGGGIDREMLDEIDAMFSDDDEYTERGDGASS
ncbi:hypothetical protein H1V43_26870 [Streptomyces sp. PSKA54]|uniref:Uncharacterized protein n=1 Tax=Streptomyces himalayensis subsp. aureolus TaxID=2758039 RepID=A0A7W2D5D3_9ACTN|nr:hypothetical protein [Streptomyces himalayensis]MBA4864909.1 hypothetical protein [Streptomyces himalayensis subsp. aureolus]